MSDERDPNAASLPDLRYIRELAKVFKQYGLDEIEIETGDQRVLLRRGPDASNAGYGVVASTTGAGGAGLPVPILPVAESPGPVETVGEFITSPFVGTFYRAPRPDAPSFVEIGSRVAKGQAVCIVEAMKLFNELEAEFDCEILEMLVDNGQPVEYGAKLYRVRKL